MTIPPLTHPRWVELVTGKIEVELSSLATKLLLTRIVNHAKLDPATVERGIDEIRTLFIKNADMPKIQEDLRRIFK